MPNKGDEITTKFKVDISDLKKGITEANQNIKLANAEFKAASAGMDNWAKSSEGIHAKLKQLASVLADQTKKLESYKKQQQQIDKAYTENGKRADELRAKMAQLASQGVSKTSEEYKKYEKALIDVEKEQDANKKASDNLRVTIANQQAIVNKTEKEMKDYEASLKDVEKAEKIAAKTGKSVEEALKDIAKESENANKKVGDLANKMAGGLKKGLTAVGAAVTGFVGSLIASSAASQEFVEDMGKLETAFTTSGHTVETAKKVYNDFVGLLGETDQSVEAANHLAKLTQNEQELAKWTNIAAGIYGTFGDSLPLEGLTEAANETAKVGQVTGPLADALNWAGVSEDAFNEALAACNSEQERSTLITQTLSDIYQEAGNTYQSVNADLIAARQATSDLSAANAEMGQTITPIISSVKQAFADFLNNITPKIKEFVNGVDWQAFGQTVENALGKIANGFAWVIENKDIVIAAISGMVAAFAAAKIIAFGSAITKVITGIKAAAAAQGIWNAVMTANPIGLIVTAIGLLVAGIVLLIQNWDKVKEAATKCWEAIKNAWNTAAEWFNTNVVEPIKNFFSGMWDTISGFFSNAWEGIKNVWNTVAEWFNTNVIEPIKNFFQPLVGFFRTSLNVIKELAQGCWNAIVAIWSAVSTWFNENVITPVKDFFTKLWDGITEAATTAWDSIKNAWNVVSDWFDSTVIQPVENFFNGMWDGVKSGASKAWEGIKSVFSPVVDWFKNQFTKAWTAVKNVFSTGGKIFDGITEGITSAFKTVVNAIIKGINKVIATPFNAINNILDNIRNVSIAGIKPFANLISRFNVPQIPLLAKGGVLKKGQMGLLEGNGAEAVVPLERNKHWIRAVAKEMQRQFAADTQSVRNVTNGISNSNVNNFTQVINAPKSPSRIELYRQTKNLLALRGV